MVVLKALAHNQHRHDQVVSGVVWSVEVPASHSMPKGVHQSALNGVTHHPGEVSDPQKPKPTDRERQADGRVTAEARNAFTIALASNPGDPRARYFLALSDYQEGREEAALRAWSDLGRSAPEGAPWLPAVQARIVETARELGEAPTDWLPPPAPDTPRGPFAGGGPTGADIAAAQEMSPEDRQEMIRGMVANLAARLEDDPDDVEGWRRLARSREVLGDNEASAEAYDRALKLDPNHPETLLRGALSAAQTGKNAKARVRFMRLRDIVPVDSELHEMVSEAISSELSALRASPSEMVARWSSASESTSILRCPNPRSASFKARSSN